MPLYTVYQGHSIFCHQPRSDKPINDTLVIQSHRSPLPYHWISRCLGSVRDWCELNGYEYRFLDDEIFDHLPAELLDKKSYQRIVATDLARLLVLKEALAIDYDTVVWLDADFLIFSPSEFIMPDQPYAVGREVWVQNDRDGKLKVYKKVHNAFLMFRRGNGFLDFYTETAARLLSLNKGAVPPQFIGPKLLTALHNVAILPVMESAGMLSPEVIRDIIQGHGSALDKFVQHSEKPLAGVNLCVSSCEKEQVSEVEMEQVVTILSKGGLTNNA